MEQTEKQKDRVAKIVDALGYDKVLLYIQHFDPTVTTLEVLNRKQAQKIITGLGMKVPHRPIVASDWQRYI